IVFRTQKVFSFLSRTEGLLSDYRGAKKTFGRHLQEVVGVKPTGELTPETVEATRRERCAQKDTRRESGRSKRFALSGTSKWDKKHFTGLHELTLKWFVSEYTNDIRIDFSSTIQKAFQLWAKQANERNLPKVTFHFEEAASQDEADINILWAEGAHGDQHEFDGASAKKNILAHTFFPGHSEPLNGDIHFDDAETWEADSVAATNYDRRFFPYVLVHEIGHALGLQHAKKQEAIMHPLYKNTPLDELKLDLDDKCAINWNYVGTSKYCLFVWLMSEIVPIHNNSDQMNVKLLFSVVYFSETRIPRCLASNDIQWQIEARLQKFLHFPPVESKTYSEVLCNFLLGLHAYRGSPDYVSSDSLEKEFNGVMKEVSFPGKTASLGFQHFSDPSYFNERFFNKFLPEYLQLQ
ncbi:unnamed protein product, partial [Haemonchus placei]|uniref:ZnMc domain-containing protein n=1 Tax=Haemonchus placei TaxID=6290 RepID=A0A0N4WDD2_HAEPC